jgi:phosphatidylethanolamine-binding protein (PEBP) family uncharacterized protein
MSATIGRMLRRVHADPRRSPLAGSDFQAPATIVLTSTAFTDGAPMPRRCAGKGVGDDISPALNWVGVPSGTTALLLLMDDVDVPLRTPLFHSGAVLDPTLTGLLEGEFRSGTSGVRIVPTMLSKTGYSGPRPIPGHGPHRYRFHLLATSQPVPDDAGSVKAMLAALAGKVTARGMLTGTYER